MSNLHILTNLILAGLDKPGNTDAVSKPAVRVAGKVSGFTVRNSSRSTLAIVTSDASAKTYAVMDLQGRVVKKGKITSSETVVPALSKGSYVVKVGLGFRHVNLH